MNQSHHNHNWFRRFRRTFVFRWIVISHYPHRSNKSWIVDLRVRCLSAHKFSKTSHFNNTPFILWFLINSKDSCNMYYNDLMFCNRAAAPNWMALIFHIFHISPQHPLPRYLHRPTETNSMPANICCDCCDTSSADTALWFPGMHRDFLSDPGIPGVRSMGPSVSHKLYLVASYTSYMYKFIQVIQVIDREGDHF